MSVALAATLSVSTLASTASSAATKPTVTTGGTAKVAIFDTFSGWCFGNNLANSALMAARTVYETLFEKTATGELKPLLAKSATPVTGSGNKAWDLVLREGIKFHDGTTFNADAVKDNFDYITGGAHYSALMAEAGRIAAGGAMTAKQTTAYAAAVKAGKTATAGLSAAGKATSVLNLAYTLSTGTAFAANILAITKTGPYSLRFTLQRAQNDLPGTLFASGRFFLRAPSQFKTSEGGDATECATNPIGTGPFMLETTKDWSTNKLTVIKNPNYWQKDAAGVQLPYLDGIVFQNIKEAPQRAAAIRTGSYDAGMFGSGGEGSNIKQLRGLKIKEIKSGVEYYPSLWLNQGKPGSPFANADARKAVVTCIDRAAFLKVRQNGEGKVAKSLVGPSSVMYSTAGLQKLNIATAKKAVADYKKATGKKKLSFSLPSDVSAASQANIKFLKAQWAKCGIEVVVKTSEAADIIAKAFNASPNLARSEFYNAYDAISITLFEGTDVSFNLPFVLTNAFSQGSDATKKYGDALGNVATVGGNAWLLNTKSAVYAGIGTVLGLNHHSDKTIDDCFFEQQAKADVTTVDYASCTQKLIDSNTMTSITHFYYTMFFSKKGKLSGYGTSTLPDGEVRRGMSNYGIDWGTVSKG
jgi:ABC-type transport system substrate-binding protein